jgi:hypothetical protein
VEKHAVSDSEEQRNIDDEPDDVVH